MAIARSLGLITSTALCVGIMFSWRAWGSSARIFPLVPSNPIFEALGPLSIYLSAGLFLCTLVIVAAPMMFRPALVGIISMSGILILIDLNRFQPWVFLYISILVAVLWGLKPQAMQYAGLISTVRLILGGCYLWSGIHKLNPSYFIEVFPKIIRPIDTLMSFSDIQMRILCVAGPLLEIAIGIALITVWQIKFVPVMCIGLHLVLLFLLGPFGLNYNSVVWPWNVAMCFLVSWVVYTDERHLSVRELWRLSNYVPKILCVLYLVLPGLYWLRAWDTYPSFALYAGFSTEGQLEFESTNDADLLVPSHEKIERPRNLPGISIIFWGAYDLNIPAYPEERIYRAVHRKVCRDPRRTAEVVLKLYDRPNMLSREREVRSVLCAEYAA